MGIGIVTGTGAPGLPGLQAGRLRTIGTPWGEADLTAGNLAGVDVVHVSRHGEGHQRLSNHVNHRANLWALKEAGVVCVVGCTACGAVDPGLPLGSLIVFDDLFFPVNRLPGGELCTFFAEPGDRRRGHWIYDRPFCEPIREALLAGARHADLQARDGGCYGHVDGPRFNTRAEIASLSAAGVAAVSQTGGPETVLAGEIEVPYALVGLATDYANGVNARPTPVEELVRLMEASAERFATVLAATLPALADMKPASAGLVYRFNEA